MADAVRDVLSVSSFLLDHSDELFGETKRVVKGLEPALVSSRTTAAALRIGAAVEVDIAAAMAPCRGEAGSIAAATTAVRAATDLLSVLATDCNALSQARVEALGEQATKLVARRQAVADELSEARRNVDTMYADKLAAYERGVRERVAAKMAELDAAAAGGGGPGAVEAVADGGGASKDEDGTSSVRDGGAEAAATTAEGGQEGEEEAALPPSATPTVAESGGEGGGSS